MTQWFAPRVRSVRWTRLATLAVYATGLPVLCIGCSSDAASAEPVNACAAFTPCGGDLVGSWNVVARCGSASLPALCPGASSAQLNVHSSTGTYVFDAQGALIAKGSTVATVTAELPVGCLGSADCPQLQAILSSQTGATSAACSATTAAECSCVLDFASQGKQQSTYFAKGTKVTITDVLTGTSQSASYCVQANTLRLNDGSSIFTLER